MKFDRDTQLEKSGGGDYRITVSAEWNIGDNPNGGYLVAIVQAALKDALAHPDPVSVTAHYLRPGIANQQADVQVEEVRSGRTLSTARATLRQEGKARVEVMAAFSDLDVHAGVDAGVTQRPPELPPPEACVKRTGEMQNIDLPITGSLGVFLDPAFATPGRSARAEMAGWIGFVDGRPPDTGCLSLFADAFPPSPLAKLGRVGWVPTIELTVHVLAKPAPGLVQAHFVTESLQQGRMIESGCLWDSEGTLVAVSRQLGLVLAQS